MTDQPTNPPCPECGSATEDDGTETHRPHCGRVRRSPSPTFTVEGDRSACPSSWRAVGPWRADFRAAQSDAGQHLGQETFTAADVARLRAEPCQCGCSPSPLPGFRMANPSTEEACLHGYKHRDMCPMCNAAWPSRGVFRPTETSGPERHPQGGSCGTKPDAFPVQRASSPAGGPEEAGTLTPFQPGRYRHYKGGFYQAHYLAHLSESREDAVVVYTSESTGETWVRPWNDPHQDSWTDFVFTNGQKRRRFELVEPSTCEEEAEVLSPSHPRRVAFERRTSDGRVDRWRVGRSVGRTLYFDDKLVGIVDTPEQARELVHSINKRLREAPKTGARAPQSEREGRKP